jgi:hypothetical protein
MRKHEEQNNKSKKQFFFPRRSNLLRQNLCSLLKKMSITVLICSPFLSVLGTDFASNVANLRTMQPLNSERIYLKCHTTEGKGGHGWFRGVTGAAVGTYTDDNGIVIVPTNGNGSAAFIREYSGAVNVKWFGAIANTNITTAFQNALNASNHIILDEDYSCLTVSLTRNTKIEGSKINLTILNSASSSGITSDQFDIDISGINFKHTKASGIYSQAITCTNVDKIKITDSTFDNFTQFTIQLSYDINGEYNSIIIDNIAVTNAGGTENGINNCLEIFHRDSACITNLISVTNSSFTTMNGTEGNIAKFGVGRVVKIENVIFSTSNRGGTSGSSAIQLSNLNNALAEDSTYYLNNIVLYDDAISLYSISMSNGTLKLENSLIGGHGIYIYNPNINNIVLSNTTFARFNIESFTPCSINNILIDSNCVFDSFDASSANLEINQVVISKSTINSQINTRNAALKILDINHNTFNISSAEHYLGATGIISFKDNNVLSGASVLPATNAFVFYGTEASVEGNIIDIGSYRSFYLSYGSGCLLNAINNTFNKSNNTIFGNIGGSYLAYNNMLNGSFKDIRLKAKTYGTAAPTTGTWIVGDKRYNLDPVSGKTIGWVCTTAGTPGTWKTFGLKKIKYPKKR